MFLFGPRINAGIAEYKPTSGALLVDVREKDEYASGHIPGAINVPLSTISNATLPKNQPIFLYCLRVTRSKRAEGILKRQGCKVKSTGGITGYKGTLER